MGALGRNGDHLYWFGYLGRAYHATACPCGTGSHAHAPR